MSKKQLCIFIVKLALEHLPFVSMKLSRNKQNLVLMCPLAHEFLL